MKKNDLIKIEIDSVSDQGFGVGRVSGMVVFIPFTAIGDILIARILKVHTSYAYGKIEEIIKSSPVRISAECPLFQKCGGCDYSHLTYEAECEIKNRVIKDSFKRIGGINPHFLPFVPSENSSGYRNKAQYPIQKDVNGKVVYGFYRNHSHVVVPQKNCLLQPKIFADIMKFIVEFVERCKISVYNENEHEGVLRHVLLRCGHYSGEILVTLVGRRNIPEFKPLAKSLKSKFKDIVSVTVNINKEKTNVIQDYNNRDIILEGSEYIKDIMCGNIVTLFSKTFYQVNTPAAEGLYKTVYDFADPKGKVIFDLYCGIGTIGLSMAKDAAKIYGVEIVNDSVKCAEINAKGNDYNNCEFIAADALDGILKLKERGIKPDVIIIDPARKGCTKVLIKEMAGLLPERIVMISCNPTTAARDAKTFLEYGYSAEKVLGVDFFPRTRHVECVVLMSRKDG